MKKSFILFLLASIAAISIPVASSCNKATTIETPEENDDFKELSLTTKQQGFVENGNTFAMRFFEAVEAQTKESYIISPISVQFVLGMLLDGASGTTAEEISTVLGYGKDDSEAVDEFCRMLLDELPSVDKNTKLTIANALFVNNDAPLKESYAKRVRDSYDAEVENLDFSLESSLKRINSWCSEKTNGLIPEPLKEISPRMQSYIINALYFKGAWKEKFSEKMTEEESFTLEDGSKGKVKMMKQESEFKYGENDLCETVSLPYGNGNFSMVVMLPKSGHTTSEVAKALTEKEFSKDILSGRYCDVNLWLPKFETKFQIQLKEILSSLGMPTAFDLYNADFKKISDKAEALGFVQQDALIKVNEEGSEAAAVTIGGMIETSVGVSRTVFFHANRPFLYFIMENSTGTILFQGKYNG